MPMTRRTPGSGSSSTAITSIATPYSVSAASRMPRIWCRKRCSPAFEHANNSPAGRRCVPGLPLDERGKWRESPGSWGTEPESVVQRKEFWQVLRRCLARLPVRMSHVFTLHEIEERSNQEVREALRISASNLWVLLHRARLGLSRCLDVHWFGRTNRK